MLMEKLHPKGFGAAYVVLFEVEHLRTLPLSPTAPNDDGFSSCILDVTKSMIVRVENTQI